MLCFYSFNIRPAPLVQSKGKKKSKYRDNKFCKIPPCPCGAERVFEYQLMPSILELLDVDCYSIGNKSKHYSIESLLSKSVGGMNWGVMAVYSCPFSCQQSAEEYVVVQDSVDGTPQEIQ